MCFVTSRLISRLQNFNGITVIRPFFSDHLKPPSQDGKLLEGERLCARLVWTTGFITPTLAIYAPLSMTLVLSAMTLLTSVSRLARRERAFRFESASTILLPTLAMLILVSGTWSFSSAQTFEKLPHTIPILLIGLLLIAVVSNLKPSKKAEAANGLALGVLLGLTVLLIERAAGGILLPVGISEIDKNYFLNQFNRPLLIFAIIVWPAFIGLERRWPKSGFMALAATFAGMFAFQTTTATLAIALGIVVSALVALAPRVFGYFFAITFAALVLLAPMLDRALPSPKQMYETLDLPRSAYHRLIIWRYTTAMIEERPLLGWGFNTSRILPDGDVMKDVSEVALPLHPHNAALQWRVELGIPGALIGAALFFFAMVRVTHMRTGWLERAGAAGSVTAAFTIAMLSFGIWQTWWISLLFLATGFCIVACDKPEAPARG